MRINKNAKKHHIVINEMYGNYLTLNEIERQNKKSIERLWEVQHVITGKKHTMRPSYLIQIQKKFQLKLESGDYQKGLKNYLYNTIKSNSVKRNHNFNLTKSFFESIISQNCHYCNDKPTQPSNNVIKTRGHINEPLFYYHGIDRLDSNLGYEEGNVVTCCSKCNYMKHTLTFNDFLSQIKKIYNHTIKQ